MHRNKILILYTRLPDYFYQSLLYFCKRFNFNADIICYPADTNTRFQYEDNEWIRLSSRTNFKFEDYIHKDYAIIYSASWRDKLYKRVCKQYIGNIPVIIGMDNPWKGSIKQRLNVLLSIFFVKPYFSHIWVAGKPQYKYAQKLGFKKNFILEGLYSADTEKFHCNNLQYKREKIILFIGRLIAYKNPEMLATAFSELLTEHESLRDWKLLFAGKGPLELQLKQLKSNNIEVNGFIEPDLLPELMQSVSVFCLPSENEHWGVVVHEAACCGLPLLLSNTVHAGTAFLEDGINGYIFKSGSIDSLKHKLFLLMNADANQLNRMSTLSIHKSKKYSKGIWSNTLYSLINTNTQQ